MGRMEVEQTTDNNLDGNQETSAPEMDPESSNGTCNVPQKTDPKCEEQNGDRMVSLGERGAEVTGDEYLHIGHCHQKMGNRWEALHFPEDGLKLTAKAVNGRKDLWMPSADRESKLEVVRTGPLYDIRAYKGENKPSRLYEEDEGESFYELPTENLSPEKAKEMEEERREVIKSQAMKKSTTIAEKGTSVDKLGSPRPTSPAGEMAEPKRRDPAEFAVCFDKPSPGWVQTVIDPENIDTEQINFTAARQQFLALEKSNPDLLLGPRKQVMSPKLPATHNIYEREHQGHRAVLKDDGEPDESNHRESDLSCEKAILVTPQITRPVSERKTVIYQNFSRENLDLGEMGRDLRTGAHNGGLPQKKSGDSLDSVASGQDPTEDLEARDETPIEREIRLSQEREENLWRERGIQRVNSRDELVEIRSKPLLSAPLSASASSRKRKDQARVSFYVQREIQQETKREEDLQKEGRLPGAYDKGTPQELRELRKVFEPEGTPLPSPCKPEHLGEVPESSPEQPAQLHIANDEERIVHHNMNQSSATAQSCPALHTRLGNKPSQSGYGDSLAPKLQSTKETTAPDAQLVLRKESFGAPMRRPKFTFPEDPRARKTDGKPQGAAAPREELYTLKTGKPRISLLIDQEIQEALQREEELQEQRRKGRLARSGEAEKAFCSHLQSQSSGKFPSESDSQTHHSLKHCPVEEEKKRRQREEGKYAGIEPMDEIDNEVVNSTKVVRHRGMRAQLWEAGQILKRGEDSDLPLFDF